MNDKPTVPFTYKAIQTIGRQLLEGIEFLHSIGYMHLGDYFSFHDKSYSKYSKDIKPENLMLEQDTFDTFSYKKKTPLSAPKPDRIEPADGNTTLRIIDFGMAREIKRSQGWKGTSHYMAPEMLLAALSLRKWDEKVDLWSVGCTLVEMYTGKVLLRDPRKYDTTPEFPMRAIT